MRSEARPDTSRKADVDDAGSRCEAFADELAASGGDRAALDRAARRHVGSCLACQAELVRYRRLLRGLAELRDDLLEPTPGLLAEILANVEAAGERHAVRGLLGGRRVAYLSGLAAATAAGAAGAIVIANRSGRLRLPIAG